MTRRLLGRLVSAWCAAVDYALALVGIVLLGAAANILLVALVVALPGGVLLLPYLLRRFRASAEAGSLSSILLRNRVAEPGVTSPPVPKPGCSDTRQGRKAPPRDTGRERVDLGLRAAGRGGEASAPSAAPAPAGQPVQYLLSHPGSPRNQ